MYPKVNSVIGLKSIPNCRSNKAGRYKNLVDRTIKRLRLLDDNDRSMGTEN